MVDTTNSTFSRWLQQLKTFGFWLKLIRDLALISIVLIAVSLYQQQGMVSGTAPDIKGHTTQGRVINGYYGQVRLVYFWGTWCPYCRVTSPMVNSLIQDYPVMTIARDSGSHGDINQYLIDHQLEFDVLQDQPDVDSDANSQHKKTAPPLAYSQQWGVTTYPSIFIIDADNSIRFISSGVTTSWGLRLRLWLASW